MYTRRKTWIFNFFLYLESPTFELVGHIRPHACIGKLLVTLHRFVCRPLLLTHRYSCRLCRRKRKRLSFGSNLCVRFDELTMNDINHLEIKREPSPTMCDYIESSAGSAAIRVASNGSSWALSFFPTPPLTLVWRSHVGGKITERVMIVDLRVELLIDPLDFEAPRCCRSCRPRPY